MLQTVEAEHPLHIQTHCNALQHTTTHCNTLQHMVTSCTITHCNTIQQSNLNPFICYRQRKRNVHLKPQQNERVVCATHRNALQATATLCSALLQHTAATRRCTQEYTAAHCTTLQHSASHFSTLQVSQQKECLVYATHCN